MTPAQAGQAVANMAYSQRGISYKNKYSKFGAWFHPNYAYALWCAMFASWSVAKALGNTRAVQLLGRQYSWSIGHAWTVSLMNDTLKNGGVRVSFDNARAGDLMFWKFPGNSRSTNPVNHVDVVYRGRSGNYVPVVGGNTPRPDATGRVDPSAGRGAWLHNRSRSYYGSYGVVIIRPNYAKYYTTKSSGYQPRRIPLGFGQGKKAFLAKIVQDIVNRSQTGTLNSGDITRLKTLQRSLGTTGDGYFGPGTARSYLASKGTLKRGSRGEAVRLWQYIIGISSTSCDGIFGATTEAYTKKAQSWAGVYADGIVGANTRKAVVK